MRRSHLSVENEKSLKGRCSNPTGRFSHQNWKRWPGKNRHERMDGKQDRAATSTKDEKGENLEDSRLATGMLVTPQQWKRHARTWQN